LGHELLDKPRDGFVPYAAPSIAAFTEIGPIGERQGCRSLTKGQEPLSSTFGKSEKRRIKAASGWPFLWILSFGDAKESISAVGPRPDIKILVAIATQINRLQQWHPVCRAEHRSFWTDQPAGAMHGCIALPKGQEAPFGNPVQKRGAQDQSGIRVSFLLDTFLWTSKEKYLGCRAETRL